MFKSGVAVCSSKLYSVEGEKIDYLKKKIVAFPQYDHGRLDIEKSKLLRIFIYLWLDHSKMVGWASSSIIYVLQIPAV